MSQDPVQYKAPISFSITVTSDEYPVRSFVLSQTKMLGMKFYDDQQKITLVIYDDEFAEMSDLQLSQFTLFLFSILCVTQFYGLSYLPACTQDFASRCDHLPNYYAQMWAECFKTMNSKLQQL